MTNKSNLWQKLKKPHKAALGSILLLGFSLGILFWGGFHTALEATNTEEFCISCHEMENNVYQEYKQTIHYMNASGVRATCSDCHVPKEWSHKLKRKIYASKELLGKVTGVIDTPEKFEKHRLVMAEREWQRMRDNDSRECRNCHDFEYMDLAKQGKMANKRHNKGFSQGKTCIDCHQGIAHELPDLTATLN